VEGHEGQTDAQTVGTQQRTTRMCNYWALVLWDHLLEKRGVKLRSTIQNEPVGKLNWENHSFA
jgi:uncharacterized protein (DUF2342 family)